jgi:2-aminoadipate transaminase
LRDYYLTARDPDRRIRDIVAANNRKCGHRYDLIHDLMPELSLTTPKGGMFRMANLAQGISSRTVFDEGVRNKVALLPGTLFYVDGRGMDTIRFNFFSASKDQITEEVHCLSRVIRMP